MELHSHGREECRDLHSHRMRARLSPSLCSPGASSPGISACHLFPSFSLLAHVISPGLEPADVSNCNTKMKCKVVCELRGRILKEGKGCFQGKAQSCDIAWIQGAVASAGN